MENQLQQLQRFQKLLENYELADRHKLFLKKTNLILLLAPSGTGRNTIIHKLVDSGGYYFIVSDTTRRPRTNNGRTEQNGVEYWFKAEDEMLQAIENGEMIEAEIIHGQQVSGVSIRELKKAYETGKAAVTDIDIGGAKELLELHPKAKVILLIPPSFEEWLRRLEHRGHMTANELRRRLQTALRIYQYALDSKGISIVANDDIHHTIQEIDSIAQGSESHRGSQLDLQVKNLLTETEKWLQNN